MRVAYRLAANCAEHLAVALPRVLGREKLGLSSDNRSTLEAIC
jgi:hypothetical protein